MIHKTRIKVSRGSLIFPENQLSLEEIAKINDENKVFLQRCRVIFNRVYPELVSEHYDWFIMIEPDSGDYFIHPDEIIALQQARQKHPTAIIQAMRLNETGTCGRI